MHVVGHVRAALHLLFPLGQRALRGWGSPSTDDGCTIVFRMRSPLRRVFLPITWCVPFLHRVVPRVTNAAVMYAIRCACWLRAQAALPPPCRPAWPLDLVSVCCCCLPGGAGCAAGHRFQLELPCRLCVISWLLLHAVCRRELNHARGWAPRDDTRSLSTAAPRQA